MFLPDALEVLPVGSKLTVVVNSDIKHTCILVPRTLAMFRYKWETAEVLRIDYNLDEEMFVVEAYTDI